MSETTTDGGAVIGPDSGRRAALSASEPSWALRDGQGRPEGLERLGGQRGRRVTPKRVRVEGDLFHGRVPEGAIYVGRAAPGLKASPYANPFKTGPVDEGGLSRQQAVNAFQYTVSNPISAEVIRMDLAGRDLACWCPLGQPCHADVLIELANGGLR